MPLFIMVNDEIRRERDNAAASAARPATYRGATRVICDVPRKRQVLDPRMPREANPHRPHAVYKSRAVPYHVCNVKC